MLAHHTYAPDAPESIAMRSAFFWSALIFAAIALFLFVSSAHKQESADTIDAPVVNTKASSYHQNKPMGSIFSVPNPQSITAHLRSVDETS